MSCVCSDFADSLKTVTTHMQVLFNTQFERRRESEQSVTRKASTLRNLFS